MTQSLNRFIFTRKHKAHVPHGVPLDGLPRVPHEGLPRVPHEGFPRVPHVK